jgi:predicted RNA-binding Zn-ribbon protein involved in translation (DUF1610 family)
MPNEAYVQVLCPGCEKLWEESPTDLPGAQAEFTCPRCGHTRRVAEFMRTDRDLEILEGFG